MGKVLLINRLIGLLFFSEEMWMRLKSFDDTMD